MNDKIKFIMSQTFSVDIKEIQDGITRDQFLNWDSLQHLILISNIEVEFNVTFEPEEISEIDSLTKIVSLLNEKIANK